MNAYGPGYSDGTKELIVTAAFLTAVALPFHDKITPLQIETPAHVAKAQAARAAALTTPKAPDLSQK